MSELALLRGNQWAAYAVIDGDFRKIGAWATEGAAWDALASSLGRTLYGGIKVGWRTIEIRDPRPKNNTVQGEIVGPVAYAGREDAESRARWHETFFMRSKGKVTANDVQGNR